MNTSASAKQEKKQPPSSLYSRLNRDNRPPLPKARKSLFQVTANEVNMKQNLNHIAMVERTAIKTASQPNRK